MRSRWKVAYDLPPHHLEVEVVEEEEEVEVVEVEVARANEWRSLSSKHGCTAPSLHPPPAPPLALEAPRVVATACLGRLGVACRPPLLQMPRGPSTTHSRMFKDVLTYPLMFKDVLTRPLIFKDVVTYPLMFKDVLTYPLMFKDAGYRLRHHPPPPLLTPI
jgi:hypothetical protein